MIDRTTSLFALPGFRVLNVTLEPDGGRLVLVESVATDGGCPSCGVMSSRIKERPICRLKDLPHGSVPLRLWVCKRRFVCTEQLCSRGSFAEVTDQVPARSRLTTRLRAKVSAAVTATNRAMREVAGDYGVVDGAPHPGYRRCRGARAGGPDDDDRHRRDPGPQRPLVPEATRLAATIERWWPEIEGFLELGNTNARTEGYNRVIKLGQTRRLRVP